jgi:hypothetical protein
VKAAAVAGWVSLKLSVACIFNVIVKLWVGVCTSSALFDLYLFNCQVLNAPKCLIVLKTGVGYRAMKIRKMASWRQIFITMAVISTFASPVIWAGTVIPGVNLTGTWSAASGGSSGLFQEGTQLTYINISSANAHYFVGRYISPTQIEGIQHRRIRATGCSTEMLVTLTINNSKSLSVNSTALDSNCDLIKGSTFIDSATKVQ